MKKIASSVVLLLLVLSLAACGTSSKDSSSAAPGSAAPSSVAPQASDTKPSEGKIKIGMSYPYLTVEFVVALRDGIKKNAELNGYEFIEANADSDPAKQAADIDDMISKGVSAIFVSPVDKDGIIPSIEKLNKAKIPVLAIDSGPAGGKLLSFIETDNEDIGRKGADYIAEQLKKRYGDYKGNVVELQGKLAMTVQQKRGKGFNEEMTSKYPNIKIVARQPTDWSQEKALNVMTNILQTQSKIDAVFGTNDDIAIGAANAIEQAGRYKAPGDKEHIIITGVDGTFDVVTQIKAGKVDATISQPPDEMAKKGIDIIKQYLVDKKDDINPTVYVPFTLITKENVDTAKIWSVEVRKNK